MEDKRAASIPHSYFLIPPHSVSSGCIRLGIAGNATSIEDSAFQGKKGNRKGNLTKVIISEGVTSIEDYAFSSLSLKNVTIPSSVRFIGISAFFWDYMTSVTLPEGVNIKEYSKSRFVAFYNKNGKKAGRYSKVGANWVYSPN